MDCLNSLTYMLLFIKTHYLNPETYYYKFKYSNHNMYKVENDNDNNMCKRYI